MPEPTAEAWAHIRYEYERTTRPVEDICVEHGISSGTLRDRMRRWRWQRRRPPIPRDGPPALATSFAPTPLPDPPPQEPATGRAAPAARPGGGREQAEFAARTFVNSNGIDSPELVRGRCEPGWGDFQAQTDHPTPPAFAGAQTVDPPSLRFGGRVSKPAIALATAGDPPPPGEGDDRAVVPPPASAANADADAASIVQRLQGATARVLPAIEAIIARLAAGPHRPREMEQAGRALGALTRTLRELNALLSQQNALAGNAYDDMPEDMDAFREDLARRIDAFMESRSGDGAEEQET